jgi:YHS domain-containing protein
MKILSIFFFLIGFIFMTNLSLAQCTDKKETSKQSNCGTVKEKDCCTSSSSETSETELKKPWNTMCPVMGEEVDSELETVEYNGKFYGFCCASCVSKFKKNPEKYSARLSDDGTKLKTSE